MTQRDRIHKHQMFHNSPVKFHDAITPYPTARTKILSSSNLPAEPGECYADGTPPSQQLNASFPPFRSPHPNSAPFSPQVPNEHIHNLRWQARHLTPRSPERPLPHHDAEVEEHEP